MSYRDIQIEPHSYEIELGIPKQPISFKDTKVQSKEVIKSVSQVFSELSEEIRFRLNPHSGNAIWGSADRRLDFIKLPDPGKLSTPHCIVANFKDRLARILFLRDNGIEMDKIRVLFFKLTDKDFAIHLQFLRDNKIEI